MDFLKLQVPDSKGVLNHGPGVPSTTTVNQALKTNYFKALSTIFQPFFKLPVPSSHHIPRIKLPAPSSQNPFIV